MMGGRLVAGLLLLWLLVSPGSAQEAEVGGLGSAHRPDTTAVGDTLPPPQDPEFPGPPTPADSLEALELFRENLRSIHQRDRGAYLSTYLQSPQLLRSGPQGLTRGYEGLARSAGESWPDTLVATHLQVTPLASGIVHGSYQYRVLQDGRSTRGVSERIFLHTPDGWRIAATSAFPSPPGTPPPSFALVGGTLVDGTGAPPVPDATVIMEDGQIVCSGPGEECAVPHEAHMVDVSGHWIIPGLVDAHVHFSQTGWADGRPDALDLRVEHPYSEVVTRLRHNPTRFFQSYLCAGVTSVFDVGGYPWTWELREQAWATPRTPRIAAAGPLLSTRDHWLNLPGERQFLHMRDRDAVRESTEYLLTSGTDAVKVWYLPVADSAEAGRQREYLELAGAWARGARVPLIVHATTLEGAREAVRAGAHLLVHSVEDREVDDEFLELARRAGTTYTPTLTVYDGYHRLQRREAPGDELENRCIDPLTRGLLEQTAEIPGEMAADEREARAEAHAERRIQMARNLRRIHAAGIPVAVGTDAGNPLTPHGPSIFAEMEAMQEAGLSPMEILVAATANGARAMDRAEVFGTLLPGMAADLVVVDQNPLEDISALRSLRLIVRGGEIFTRDELSFPQD